MRDARYLAAQRVLLLLSVALASAGAFRLWHDRPYDGPVLCAGVVLYGPVRFSVDEAAAAFIHGEGEGGNITDWERGSAPTYVRRSVHAEPNNLREFTVSEVEPGRFRVSGGCAVQRPRARPGPDGCARVNLQSSFHPSVDEAAAAFIEFDGGNFAEWRKDSAVTFRPINERAEPRGLRSIKVREVEPGSFRVTTGCVDVE